MFRMIGKLIKNIFNLLLVILAILLGVTFALTVIYPLGYREEIVEYSEKQDIDPFLVASIIRTESNFYNEAVSKKDAKGLMQITPTTAEWISNEINEVNFTEDDLFDPKTNIKFGTWYLNRIGTNYDDLDIILSCYNAGSGNVSEWLKDKELSSDGLKLDKIPFKETDEYVKKVKSNKKIYKLLYKDIIYKDDLFTKYYFKVVINLRDFIKSVK